MNAKIKYLVLIAGAFLVGFSSCSSNDEMGAVPARPQKPPKPPKPPKSSLYYFK